MNVCRLKIVLLRGMKKFNDDIQCKPVMPICEMECTCVYTYHYTLWSCPLLAACPHLKKGPGDEANSLHAAYVYDCIHYTQVMINAYG